MVMVMVDGDDGGDGGGDDGGGVLDSTARNSKTLNPRNPGQRDEAPRYHQRNYN
jgi:hypothetical protein